MQGAQAAKLSCASTPTIFQELLQRQRFSGKNRLAHAITEQQLRTTRSLRRGKSSCTACRMCHAACMPPIWQPGECNAFALRYGQFSENIMNRSYPASSHTGGEA
jgi:dissimilatory sulfite reductase (desulfoviridin) alpha/beta subunit